MIPTNNISVFLRHNHSELRFMLTKICKTLKFQGNIDDVMQDVYLKFLTSNILQSYNRHFCTGKDFSTSRMSTYLYPILKNFVLVQMKSKEYRYQQKRLYNYNPYTDEEESLDNIIAWGYKGNNWARSGEESKEKSIRDYQLALEYKDIVNYNRSFDSVDGTAFEIRHFYDKFKKSIKNKKFKKSINDNVERSLSEVFRLIYEGYSNKEIAKMLKVTEMTIIHLKHKIAKCMLEYGFSLES